MNWMRLALITIAAGILTSLTDWLFAGDWLHRRTRTLKSGGKEAKLKPLLGLPRYRF